MPSLPLVLVLALSVLALPKPDLLGVLDPVSSAPFQTRHALKPSTRSSVRKLTASQTSQTPVPTQQTESTQQTAVQTAVASTSALPASAVRHDLDYSNKTWQIIGIIIIAVLFIATSITCAMFFDRFWRFLKDVIRCTSRPVLSEEFITDREKESYTRTRPRELPWNARDWNKSPV